MKKFYFETYHRFEEEYQEISIIADSLESAVNMLKKDLLEFNMTYQPKPHIDISEFYLFKEEFYSTDYQPGVTGRYEFHYGTNLKIDKKQYEFVIEQVVNNRSLISCGVLGGHTDKIVKVIPTRNCDIDPWEQWAVDDRDLQIAMDQLRDESLQNLGFYIAKMDTATRRRTEPEHLLHMKTGIYYLIVRVSSGGGGICPIWAYSKEPGRQYPKKHKVFDE